MKFRLIGGGCCRERLEPSFLLGSIVTVALGESFRELLVERHEVHVASDTNHAGPIEIRYRR